MIQMIKDFEEIELSEVVITFYVNNGRGSINIKHDRPTPATLLPVNIDIDGQNIWYNILIGDNQDFFGRKCPECETYFRVMGIHLKPYASLSCPFCLHHDHFKLFHTENQIIYLKGIIKEFIEFIILHQHSTQEQKYSIVLSSLFNDTKLNKPIYSYTEIKQQSLYTCQSCKTIYDVLGEYAVCPNCITSNFKEVLLEKLQLIEDDFNIAKNTLTDRNKREYKWESLIIDIHNVYDNFYRKITELLLRFPATSKRKKQIKELSPFNVENLKTKFSDWFAINLDAYCDKDDHDIFNKRHIGTHRGNTVDQEYIDATGDLSYIKNEKIRYTHGNVISYLKVVKKLCVGIIKEIETIQ